MESRKKVPLSALELEGVSGGKMSDVSFAKARAEIQKITDFDARRDALTELYRMKREAREYTEEEVLETIRRFQS